MKPDEPSYKGENVKGADGIEIKPGDLVEWIDCGKHEGAVTLVDYDRIVVDGKHSVAAIDVHQKRIGKVVRYERQETEMASAQAEQAQRPLQRPVQPS